MWVGSVDKGVVCALGLTLREGVGQDTESTSFPLWLRFYILESEVGKDVDSHITGS